MKQLRSGGFSLETIAKVFATDRETVYYHVKNSKKGDLVELAKALIPHLPLEGPPLPRGYSLRWVETYKLKKETRKSRLTLEKTTPVTMKSKAPDWG
jgi:hypothetical protein